MTPALALAPLILAAVLVFSGLAKLPDPAATHSMMNLLRLPGRGAHGALARVVPWAELTIASLLLTPWWPTFALGAVAAIGLFATFWVIIARAMTFDPRPTCGCFGRVGDNRVAPKTVWRNSILVALALLTGWIAWERRTATGLVADFGANDWWWLLLAIALATVAVLILGGSVHTVSRPGRKARRAMKQQQEEAERAAAAPAGLPEEEELEYERRPIPAGVLLTQNHDVVELQTMARQQAQLLVLVNCWCGPTMACLRSLPEWRARLPQLGVSMSFTQYPYEVQDVSQNPHGMLWDPGSRVYNALGAGASPAAVLLGADGLLAGGPVNGHEEIQAFVDEIAEQLAEAGAQVPAGPTAGSDEAPLPPA